MLRVAVAIAITIVTMSRGSQAADGECPSSREGPSDTADSGERPGSREYPSDTADSGLSLLQKSFKMLKGLSGTNKHATKANDTAKPAGWFGSFSMGESTYTYDGTFANRNENPAINVMDGWNPQQMNPYEDKVVPHQWFEESASGGYKEAFQTFYPAVPAGAAGTMGVTTGAWYTGTGGIWQQNYQSPHEVTQTGLPAGWFDDSVNQIDGFGRKKFPALGSPQNFLYWEERSVNTTLTCAAAGCTANVSLQAPFNPTTEVYKDCKLSVYFHPTDYDDQYAGEEVEWVQVNNALAGSSCHPFADGCNASASRPLIPCVQALPVDHLIPSDGVLHVAAKIATVVDECPYNGNLLSAVPMVTCLVAPKSMALEGEVAPAAGVKPVSLLSTCNVAMPLQCPTRGCAAEIVMPVDPSCASAGKKCILSVAFNQTDFDNLDGTPELIEYIKVQGQPVASDLKPGQNPCMSKWHGEATPPAALTYTAIKDHDVTSQLLEGKLLVEAKISRYVDECASNGYLLDAVATVSCA